MGTFYIPKSGKRRKRKPYSLCRLCKAKIMWTVTELRKNMPIEYDPELEYLYDGIAKVPFDRETMKAHWAICPHSHIFRRRT